MPFEKRPWLVAFWLNDRKLPLIPWKMSVAECVGSLTVILGVGRDRRWPGGPSRQ